MLPAETERRAGCWQIASKNRCQLWDNEAGPQDCLVNARLAGPQSRIELTALPPTYQIDNIVMKSVKFVAELNSLRMSRYVHGISLERHQLLMLLYVSTMLCICLQTCETLYLGGTYARSTRHVPHDVRSSQARPHSRSPCTPVPFTASFKLPSPLQKRVSEGRLDNAKRVCPLQVIREIADALRMMHSGIVYQSAANSGHKANNDARTGPKEKKARPSK